MVMIMAFFLLLKQNASLWSSLLLIPISILIIKSMGNATFMSGVLSIMIILVFVGGLLVLLVSITSLSYQEQSESTSIPILSLLLIFSAFLMSWGTYDFVPAQMVSFTWILSNLILLSSLLIIILMGLLVISWFFLQMKSFTRSI